MVLVTMTFDEPVPLRYESQLLLGVAEIYKLANLGQGLVIYLFNRSQPADRNIPYLKHDHGRSVG